jgi:dolichol-phosphate mannosyltransferase
MAKPIAMVATYNEAGNIERLIGQILGQGPAIEVVVVDDDSPDGTGGIVARLAETNPRIHLISRKGVRGRTSAGVEGFKYAIRNGYDPVVEMDADFSHDPGYIPALLEAAGEADVAIGSRYVAGGGTEHRIFPQHQLSRFANLFNIIVLGLKVKDSSGGYKCYRRKVLQAIDLDHIISKGYCVGAELLYRCKKARFTMKEVPIVFKPRAAGKSKLDWRIVLEYPLTVLRLRLTL